MGNELKWLLKKGGGHIFDISLENTPTSHAVSLALVFFSRTCSDSAMPLLLCACLHNNSNDACRPSCCFFLLNITACMWHKWVGVLLREKHPLQQLHFKKGGGGGAYFRGWAYFREITVIIAQMEKRVQNAIVANCEP